MSVGITNEGTWIIEIDEWTPEAKVLINKEIIKVNSLSYQPNLDVEHEIIIKFKIK